MFLDYKFEWLFLFDSKKHLKPASFTSVVGSIGAVGVIYNYTLQKVTQEKINNKKLVAEIIAKSRIEWLKEMREHVSTYMSLANQASAFAEDNLITIYERSDMDILSEYNNFVQKTEIIYYKISFNMNNSEPIFAEIEMYKNIYNINILYGISSDKEREKAKFKADLMKEFSRNIVKYDAGFTPEPSESENKEITEKIKELGSNSIANYRKSKQVEVGKSIQTYFKKEWDKAKEEIRSGEVATPDIQEKQF